MSLKFDQTPDRLSVVTDGINSWVHLRLFSAAPVKDTSDTDLKSTAFWLKAVVWVFCHHFRR